MSDKLIPVFKIKPQGPTNAIIKYKGLINEEDKLIDDIVELDKCNNNTISVELINKYTITGHIYKCNIIGSHIVSSTKYPVIYILAKLRNFFRRILLNINA